MDMRGPRWVSSLVFVLIWPTALFAQPAFEVASVRQNTSGDTRTFASPGLLPTPFGPARPGEGPVLVSNMQLRDVIARAFDINPALAPHVMTGGPARLLEMRFDINARRPEGAPLSETLAMLRTLLAERFKLKVHVEKRDIPVYALVVRRQGQLGPQLRESKIDCDAPGARKALVDGKSEEVCRLNVYGFGKPGRGDLTISDVNSVASLIVRIQPFLDRPVVDATGLSGTFQWSISFAANPESTTAPVIYTALEEQLGLRVERRSAPYDVVIIDSVEMPTPD
jgi:uncharacterized protein (TIGR03435 family)